MSRVRKLARALAMRLNRPGARWILRASIPAAARFARDGVRKIDYADGWVHRFDKHITVELEPRLRSYHIGASFNRALWCYLYTPQAGDTVLDVGAGVGSESVYFANAVGPRGRLISIEAHPLIFQHLRRTLELNGFEQATALNLAVSDAPGELFIENDLENFLGNAVSQGSGEISVPARTLDDICTEQGVERIDLLKMNIEGAERAALLGMRAFLARTAVVAISCHDFKFRRTGNSFFRTKAEVETQLTALGFVLVPRESARQEIADQVNAYNPALIDESRLSPGLVNEERVTDPF